MQNANHRIYGAECHLEFRGLYAALNKIHQPKTKGFSAEIAQPFHLKLIQLLCRPPTIGMNPTSCSFMTILSTYPATTKQRDRPACILLSDKERLFCYNHRIDYICLHLKLSFVTSEIIFNYQVNIISKEYELSSQRNISLHFN